MKIEKFTGQEIYDRSSGMIVEAYEPDKFVKMESVMPIVSISGPDEMDHLRTWIEHFKKKKDPFIVVKGKKTKYRVIWKKRVVDDYQLEHYKGARLDTSSGQREANGGKS